MPEQSDRTLKIYRAEQVSLEQLKTVLGDGRLTWAFAMRMEDTGLDWLRDLLTEQPLGAPINDRPGVPLASWSQGRAFGPELEVDWWRKGEAYRLRALLEKGEPPESLDWGTPVSTDLKAHGNTHSLLLYGILDESSSQPHLTWSEARIPRRLAHPYDVPEDEKPPEQVALVVQNYARKGAVILTRLLEVISAHERKAE